MAELMDYDEVLASFDPTLGLEVHVELNTATKMFCGCDNSPGGEPNTKVCPVCLGLPGSLPVVNGRAVESAIRIGLALGCSIAPWSRFARKNYFYPVMTKDFLTSQYDVYRHGEIPALPSRLHVNLFNTLRAAMFPARYPMQLVRRTDPRGSLVETVRAHGSEGQTFISTTVPGITRGQHFHLRKAERFVVVGGQARISLRRVLTDEAVSFDVDGASPVVVDMPTLWTHNITNTGAGELTTMFWTNELFDPEDADTYAEEV